jgi:hypothetical protein
MSAWNVPAELPIASENQRDHELVGAAVGASVGASVGESVGETVGA